MRARHERVQLVRQAVKLACIEAGCTQRAIATALGVGEADLSAWIGGVRPMRRDLAERLAGLLGLDLAAIASPLDPPPSPSEAA